MLHISHPQINVGDLWYPAMWTSCQVSISLCLSSCHPTQSRVTSAGELVMFMSPCPCFPQKQKQIRSHEACVTFLPTAALPRTWQGLCLSPSTAKGHKGQGMHTPGAAGNRAGGQWEKYAIEKSLEEAKIEERKGKLKKDSLLLRRRHWSLEKSLFDKAFLLFPNSSCRNVDKKHFPPDLDKINWDVP